MTTHTRSWQHLPTVGLVLLLAWSAGRRDPRPPNPPPPPSRPHPARGGLVLRGASPACGGHDTTTTPTDGANNGASNNGATNNGASDNNGNVGNNGNNGSDDCTPGFLGCPCVGGLSCWPGSGWICDQDVCREPTCTLGSERCGCYANNTCDRDAQGQRLQCTEGICTPPTCAAGTMGCPCADGGSCQGELVCTLDAGEGRCLSPSCPAGSLDCPCAQDRACDGALICHQGACVVPGCTVGSEGCYCDQALGCQDGASCNADGRCEAIGCTPGTVGCACDDGACAAQDAFCDRQGRCQRIDCPEGQEGCACSAAQVCGMTDQGEPLSCEAGTCRRPACAPGDPGCVCAQGWSCAGDGECIEGYCRPAGCAAGTEHCLCAAGGCAQGLICRDRTICVDNTGLLGGGCFDNATCASGLRCQGGVCTPCLLGSQACACNAGSCNAGLVCLSDHCVAEGDIAPEPPAHPRCHTPCRQGLASAEGYRECIGGYLDGCVGDKACDDGSCIGADEPVPTCQDDGDCPQHQTCIAGRCYSNCEHDADCAVGLGCDDFVCRPPCRTDADTCPRGTFCDTDDSTLGYCTPYLDPRVEPAPVRRGDGTFTLSTTTLELSNVTPGGSFQIVNDSTSRQTFRVRKRRHTLFPASGDPDRTVYVDDGRVRCDPAADRGCTPDDDDPTRGTCVDCRPCDPAADAMSDGACVPDATRSHTCNATLGACRPDAGCAAGTCPLFFLRMGERGQLGAAEEVAITLEPGQGKTLEVGSADGSTAASWTGTLEVHSAALGDQQLHLSYRESPEGLWRGTMVYLSEFGTQHLDAWRQTQTTRSDPAQYTQVGNALIQRWGAFRRGRTRGWDELQAVLMSIHSGSWAFPNVVDGCPGDACYLYADIGTLGREILSNNLDSVPVPSGVLDLPIAFNLRASGPADPTGMTGRIESSVALQYPGNPTVDLHFAVPPDTCSLETGGACLVFMDTLQSDVIIGGRYATHAADGAIGGPCLSRPGDGFLHTRTPWLVPGFLAGTSVDPQSGLRYKDECRDGRLPLDATNDPAAAAIDVSLALANPIPDGRTRRRHLELLDGALINQAVMVILFKESFDSFLGATDSQGFASYGYMILHKDGGPIDPTDDDANDIPDVFEGARTTDDRVEPDGLLDVACDPQLVQEILGPNQALTAGNASSVVDALISGVAGAAVTTIDAASDEEVHYLCVDTGTFSGGPNARSPGGAVSCPEESEVRFFTVDKNLLSAADIAALPCQQPSTADPTRGTCALKLEDWITHQAPVLVQAHPIWRCVDDNAVFCDRNRLDLRDGKRFYAAGSPDAVFIPLQTAIDQAFRYKTRFRNRSGTGVGFAPEICQPRSDLTPYCYDPELIEQIAARTRCLLDIHGGSLYDALAPTTRSALDATLDFNFSYAVDNSPDLPAPVSYDGFERLHAELLIMLGDDAFTRAFASRYDLANQRVLSFEGERFEPGGVNLSGAAGFELYSLYQAAQYYDAVLEHFYAISPLVWKSIGYGLANRNFISPETVITWFDRLIRASTQKAKAWSEVARRYQAINRPDLARRVAERAYISTWLEARVMSRMMLDIVTVSRPEDRAQIRGAVDDAQRRYRSALLDMQNVHSSIEDNLTAFGYPADYIPFPALDSANFRESNAFEALLLRTQTRVQIAREREESALGNNRSFETDQAQFQSELVQIRNTYENQLAEVCGTFVGPDARVYPAIEKYAYLDERATVIGDPCGLAGNGQLHDARAALEQLQIDMDQVIVGFQNVAQEIAIEQQRLKSQCDLIDANADYVYRAREGDPTCTEPTACTSDDQCRDSRVCTLGSCRFQPGVAYRGCDLGINRLQDDIEASQFTINRLQTAQSTINTVAGLATSCDGNPLRCALTVGSSQLVLATTLVSETAISAIELQIQGRQRSISRIESETARWETQRQCAAARIDGDARVKSLALRNQELELEALRAEYRYRLAMSDIERLRNTARRLQMEQREAEQLAINVEAAHNDPNVRIYKNDAILNADVAFEDALREVYKLTRVFEYYTSQSYAARDDLFLVRLVGHGDNNLENYLIQLENAFYEFEELFGNPAVRVHRVSLLDDIFAIPRLDANGRALSTDQRKRMFAERLTDPGLLDEHGYISIPFGTRLESLSPLTRNHKILYLEAELVGSGAGDRLSRVYLRQKGTSAIHGVEDDDLYYRFDERTAVINSYIAGSKTGASAFTPDIYQSYRMRDRPLVNTQWELVINQRDEEVNEDLNLALIDDIRVYFFYSDFTVF